MLCSKCGDPIPQARLDANPDTDICRPCLELSGDVARVKGFMVWDHKTAPHIQLITNERLADELARSTRKGVHAQLPMATRSGEPLGHDTRAEFDVIGGIPSRCHPDSPRVGPSGKCLACSLNWYKLRLP